MNHDYAHTWEFDRNSRFIRAYLWLYQADENKIDFCRLWWGFWFAPLALLAHIVIVIAAFSAAVFSPILTKLIRAFPRFQRDADSTYLNRVKKELDTGPSRLQEALTSISAFVDRCVGFVQAHPLPWEVLAFAVGTVALYGLVFGLSWLLVYGKTVWIFDAFFYPLWLWFMISGRKSIGRRRRTEPSKQSPFRFLATGLHSIKTRTCPRVVIRQRTVRAGDVHPWQSQ